MSRAWSCLLLCLIDIVSIVGCASKAAPNECSVNVPESCPDPSLSYAASIGDILSSNCQPCHAAGGVERAVPLTDYSDVSKRLTSIAGQLETCTMPPAGSPPISASDRQTVLDWIVCGAPQ